MTTGKTIAFVGKVMSLLFNMLSRLVIAFLPRSKCLLISWSQSPSAVTLEPPKIKSVTISIVSPSICHEVMGPDAMILVFWTLSFKPPVAVNLGEVLNLTQIRYYSHWFTFNWLAYIIYQWPFNVARFWVQRVDQTWVQFSSLQWERG